MKYDYTIMQKEAELLCREYGFIEMFGIGKSVTQRDLYCIKVGTGKRKILITATHHGQDFIISKIVIDFLKNYAHAIITSDTIADYSAEKLFHENTIYVVPMVNPDGVDIALNGIDIENPYHKELLKYTGVHNFENSWQSNICGVDLAYNYDAYWEPIAMRVGPERYSGPYAHSEPEVQGMVQLMDSISFDLLIDFCGAGGRIIYDSNNFTAHQSFLYAHKFEEVSGYSTIVSKDRGWGGSIRDWFISKYNKEGFTIALGSGINTLPMSVFNTVYPEATAIILSALSFKP